LVKGLVLQEKGKEELDRKGGKKAGSNKSFLMKKAYLPRKRKKVREDSYQGRNGLEGSVLWCLDLKTGGGDLMGSFWEGWGAQFKGFL